ncbi:hypothetical protein DNTS_022013 [Danionella cerebrum]|uniref:Neurogranin n=1 Tax=Danionella cerebrum TaxID=2873325 RepID=A0A553QQS1_9TELE|nr:hypothetical protein DNTS_022013 [Danionella translucida]
MLEGCAQPQDEDIMDIPLDDPAANKAAAKIQAGFRGHMTRKKMKDDKPREENSPLSSLSDVPDIETKRAEVAKRTTITTPDSSSLQ